MKWLLAIAFLLLTFLVLPLGLRPVAAGLPIAQTVKTWGGTGFDYGQGVAIDAYGDIYETGYTSSFGPGSPSQSALFLLKYNSTDILQWQRIWSGPGNASDYGYGVVVDASGNVIVVGYTLSFGDAGPSVLLLKFDSLGNLLWQKIWAPYGGASGYGVAVDSSNDIYVTGTMSRAPSAGTDVFLMKVDPSGSLVWAKTWNGTPGYAGGGGYGVVINHSGYAYVTGYQSGGGPGGNSSDVLLLKLASNGTLIWQRNWGGSGNDVGRGLAIDSFGNVYVTGYTNSTGDGGDDVLLLKLNATGNLLWERTWGGTAYDEGYAVALSPIGDLWITGMTFTLPFGNGEKALLLNMDSSGSLITTKAWGGNGNDWGYGVVVDSSGNAVVTGYVTEAPSYTLSYGNTVVGTPSFLLGNPGIPLSGSIVDVRTPPGVLITVSGSQTYAGFSDSFMLAYGYPSYLIRFQTSTGRAAIYFSGQLFTGQDFQNEQSYQFHAGLYQAEALTPAGYSFASWASTSNLTISSITANPTNITVTGAGTLSATFTPTAGAPTTSLQPSAILLFSPIMLSAYLIRRRKAKWFSGNS